MANAQAGNPVFTEPLALTATIARKRFVKPDGSGYPAAGGNALGASLYGGVSGDSIAVVVSGIAILEAGGNIAIGDYVTTDASGKAVVCTALAVKSGATQVTSTAANGATVLQGSMTPEYVLGRALSAAANGDDVRILLA